MPSLRRGSPLTATPDFLTPQDLKLLLTDEQEIALLDVREVGPFSEEHLWRATNLPLSRLELGIRRFVPRLNTRVVLCDGDDGLARRAAEVLMAFGYTDLSILSGGIDGCRAAGHPLISGNYVIAHCYGYAIEEAYQTPVMTAVELRRRLAEKEPVIMLDARDEDDYAMGSIPGSLSIPAVEAVNRISPLIDNSETPVVVHCAGITRAALGAQGLINCGIQNPVFALEDGTRGWVLAGGELEPEQPFRLSSLPEDRGDFSRKAANELVRRFDLTRLSLSEQLVWQRKNPDRTCYFIDVRSREEYEAGHLRGALSIPGGELAGMTVDHLATWHARLCLLSEPECGRAELTASWMRQLGWSDVVVIGDWRIDSEVVAGPESDPCPDLSHIAIDTILPQALLGHLAEEKYPGKTLVLDFSPSPVYRAGHIPGAVWVSRVQLFMQGLDCPNVTTIICTSPKGRIARLAAAELQDRFQCSVKVLEGGNRNWVNAGYPWTDEDPQFSGYIDDVDATVNGPDGKERKDQEAWHRKCINWRHTLFPSYEEAQPWSFALPEQS